MNKVLVSSLALLSALAVFEAAKADEAPAKPKRERAAAAPARAAPAQQQASNWSGGQVGGSNGVSSVNNGFVEPGAYVCPFGSSIGSNCFETPFSFSGHKAAYTIGPFVGYRVQWGNWVVGIEGDWSYKNSETSLSQSSPAAIAVTGSNYVRTDQFSGSVKQKSDSSIRARVGTLVTPWSLLYVTGGVAFGEISGSFAYAGSLYFCPGSSSGRRLRDLVDEHGRHGNDRGDLERYTGWQHGRRGMGNRDRAPLEGQGRVPLHGLRQLHQDLRADHPLHRQLRRCLQLHRYAVEQREHRSEGIVPHLPRRSRLRPVIATLGA